MNHRDSFIAVILALALCFGAAALVGCGDEYDPTKVRIGDVPTPAPTRPPLGSCTPNVTCFPRAVGSVAYFYQCSIAPAGPVTYIVNGVNILAGDGILVESAPGVPVRSGDIVSACRDGCGCSLPGRLP